MTTAERCAEVRAALAESEPLSPAPWDLQIEEHGSAVFDDDECGVADASHADAALIVTLRNHVPALIEALERVEALAVRWELEVVSSRAVWRPGCDVIEAVSDQKALWVIQARTALDGPASEGETP